MSQSTHRQRVFSSLRDKTLSNVLRQLFVTEFGYERKVIFAEAMIERILETLEAFTKPAALLKPGQMLWMAVANDGSKHAQQAMKEIPQVPVVLDWLTAEDLQALTDGQDYRVIRRQRYARILDQAFAQKGVLAQSDLAAMALASATQVRSDLARVQKEEHRILPYRGTVQDAGGTMTHKVEVARLLEAGYLEPEICRRLSMPHNLRSVENYAQTYKNVIKLLERGFAPSEVSGILSIGLRLVNAYIEIVQEHHPKIVERNPHLQERMSPEGALPDSEHKSGGIK
ncbi:MAG: DUF1670 domain-containing protein [Planctomycetota bacterium]|jgi:hypothetical protein